MRSIIINKKFYCSRRKLWKNKSWNCVVCSPNKMAEVVAKSIQKWDHTSRCHLQDHEIWLAAILFGCQNQHELYRGQLFHHSKWNNSCNTRTVSNLPLLECYLEALIFFDRLLQRGNKCNQVNIHRQGINNKDWKYTFLWKQWQSFGGWLINAPVWYCRF